jgi:DNA-binding transcriptional regulator LsrR (DeoR family)
LVICSISGISLYFEVSIDDLLGHLVDVQAEWEPMAAEGALRWKLRRRAETPRRILAKARSVDIAFMGLGILGRRRAPIDLLGDLLETGPGIEELRRRGAVGGVRVVAIASGQEKAEIARAAIRAGYANVFIIDDELDRALLESEQAD